MAFVAERGDGDDDRPTVPAPVAPDDPDAWYAPDVCVQYVLAPRK